jgi:hypothetical protein
MFTVWPRKLCTAIVGQGLCVNAAAHVQANSNAMLRFSWRAATVAPKHAKVSQSSVTIGVLIMLHDDPNFLLTDQMFHVRVPQPLHAVHCFPAAVADVHYQLRCWPKHMKQLGGGVI